MNNETPLSYMNYQSKKMLNIIESNKENLISSLKPFMCEETPYIYEFLLKTGEYINAKDDILIFYKNHLKQIKEII